MKTIIISSILVLMCFEWVQSYYINCFDNYDYSYDDYPEVVFIPPEKLNNLIEFLRKVSKNSNPIFPKQRDVETTTKYSEDVPTVLSTEGTTLTSSEAIITSTEATTIGISTTESNESAKTTVESAHDIEDPVEDIDNNLMNRNDEATTTKTITAVSQDPNPGSMDYDDEYERDSEEDLLSSKKKLNKLSQTTQSPSDDDNNSKPKNINSWLRF